MCWFKPFKNPTNKKVSESKTHHLKHIRKPGQDIKSLIRKQQTHLIYHPKDIRTQHVRGLVRFSGCDYLPGCQRNSSTVTVYWFQKGTLNLLGSHRTILHNVKERERERGVKGGGGQSKINTPHLNTKKKMKKSSTLVFLVLSSSMPSEKSCFL